MVNVQEVSRKEDIRQGALSDITEAVSFLNIPVGGLSTVN